MAGILITEAEILDALAAASKGTGPLEARTGTELAEDTGIGIKRVLKALHRADAEGRLERHRLARRNLAGAQIIVTGFTIKPAPKKAKR